MEKNKQLQIKIIGDRSNSHVMNVMPMVEFRGESIMRHGYLNKFYKKL